MISSKGRIGGAVWAAGVLGLFGLYLFSVYPAVSPYRDSGDMAAAALSLGVAHPPGYPFYLLVAHLWLKFLGLGSVALRLNILSAAAGAAAAGVLAVAVRRDSEGESGRWAGPLTALLLLGLAPAFRHLSLVSEMYSLNALVGALLLLLMISGGKPGGGKAGVAARQRRLCLGAMLFGLGLGNHQTLAAALPGLLWIAHRDMLPSGRVGERGFWLRRLPRLLFFAGLGFALYAYLPLRSGADPLIDWGEPETLRNFWRMLTRADYGGVRLHPSRAPGLAPALWGPGLLFSARLFIGEFTWPGALLAVWGLWSARRRPAAQGSALALLAAGPLFIVWANLEPAKAETYAILQPHLVLPLVFAAALAGWGAADIFRRARFQAGFSRRGRSEKVFGRGARLLRPALGPALAAALLAAGWALSPPGRAAPWVHRQDYSAWDFGKGLLSTIERDALLLDPDDATAFTLGYLAAAHGVRKDVLPLLYFRTRWGYEQIKRRHPELLPSWEIGSGQQLLGTLVSRNLAAGRRIYMDLPQKTPLGHASYPAGMAYRLRKRPPEIDERLDLYRRAEQAGRLVFYRAVPQGAGFFTAHTAEYWASALNNLGIEALRMRWPDAAIALFRRALLVAPGLSEAWNNMGNVAVERHELDTAEGCYLSAVRLKLSPRAVYNLGRVYLLAGRFQDAERELRRSIALGGPPDARNDLGLVFLRAGQAQRAVEAWTDLLSDRPEYYLAYYNLALGYERLGRRDKAAEALRVYRELAPSPAEKRAAAEWMERLRR